MGQKRSLHVFEEAEEEAFRAAEAEAMKAEGDILRSVGALASEVEALLSDVLGTEAFVDGVTALKKAKKAKEDERKRKRAVGALLDPQADARRKLRRAEKRKVARKRKIEDYKEQRGK
jgi:U3 small nucleolar RNA-associated protein 20